jgi:hypothetical protein
MAIAAHFLACGRALPMIVGGAVLALIGPVACEAPVAQHTVGEYRANPALRREQMALCMNDPGTLGGTPNCINAREAQRLEDSRSVRDLPPVQLPGPGSPRK